MRPAALFLIAIALSIVPHPAWGQVSVTAPVAGAVSSYRNTVVSWDPIPGASSYHLEIDDDPNFGSPEVDVIVPGTSYALSGERLKLHGRLQWAAYVRINGTRWSAGTFTPSYFKFGGEPKLAIDSQNRAYLAFKSLGPMYVTTSNDWSNTTRISLEETFNAHGLDLVVDEHDVAHAFWYEQSQTEGWVPSYSNSATGWDLVRIPDPDRIGSSCAETSIVAGGGQIDLFYAKCAEKILRWTSTDGVHFAQTEIPNNDSPVSVSAARDGIGNLYIASERLTGQLFDHHSSVQTSADGWLPHRFGLGRFPSIAVTPTGELHALRWGEYQEGPIPGIPLLYSNSLRHFQAWTELATNPRVAFFEQDVLPLVADTVGGRLYAAVPGDGVEVCSAAYTGLVPDTGTAWSCTSVGRGRALGPDLALAPDGTVHVSWLDPFGLGYANSLGSFLATNFPPQVSFGMPSSTASSVIVPTTIADVDTDDLSGHIVVGRYEPVEFHVAPETSTLILPRRYTLWNLTNSRVYASGVTFRIVGRGEHWESLNRASLPALPVMVEVIKSGEIVGAFAIRAWDETGVTISQVDFVSHVTLNYSETLPAVIDISTLPNGELMLAVAAWDGSTSAWRPQSFSKSPGQVQLVLTPPAPAAEKLAITDSP
jgi:hypothetical protein